MADFRTARLYETENCNFEYSTVVFDPSTKQTYSCQLSTILNGGYTKGGLIKTGYVTMATNPKCYPLSVDSQGRGYAKIQWFDSVISTMTYDSVKKALILKMNDPKIDDIEIPVNDLVNVYYPDNTTISAKGNTFGVKDKTLEPNGNYISAFSSTSEYTQTRVIDGMPQQRNSVQFQYCVRTEFDYNRTRNATNLPIIDYRNPSVPKVEYWDSTTNKYTSEILSSYTQLHGKYDGLDIRVGEFLYNSVTSKLWYLQSTNVSTLIQLDQDFSKVTYYDNL